MKRNWKKLPALLIVLALCAGMVPAVFAANVASSSHQVTISIAAAPSTTTRGSTELGYTITLSNASASAYCITAMNFDIPLVGCTYDNDFTLISAPTGYSATATVTNGTLRIGIQPPGDGTYYTLPAGGTLTVGSLSFTAGSDLAHNAPVSANISGGFHKQNEDNYYVLDQVTYATVIDYSFAVNIAEAAHGSVTTSPSGMAGAATTVTYTAVPDPGYRTERVHVSKTASGSPHFTAFVDSQSFTMPAEDVTVTPTFTPTSYTISYSIYGQDNSAVINGNTVYGTGNTLAGGNLGQGINVRGTQSYNIESPAFELVEVTPGYDGLINAGWQVVSTVGNWTAGEIIRPGTEISGRYGNVTLEYIYVCAPNLTLSAVDHATVTLSATTANTPHQSGGTYLPAREIAEGETNTVQSTSTVTVNITPDTGWTVGTVSYTINKNGSTSNVNNSGSGYAFTMNYDHLTVNVTMVPAPFDVDTDDTDTHVSVTVSETATYGSTVDVTVTPEDGYAVDGVTVTGNTSGNEVEVTGSGSDWSFTMPAEAVTIAATSTPATYTIYFDDEDGTNLGTKTYTLATGGTLGTLRTSATAVALPTKTGFAFARWSKYSTTGNWSGSTYEETDYIGGLYGDVHLRPIFDWSPTVVMTDYKYAGGGEGNANKLLLVGDVVLESGKALTYGNGTEKFLYTTTDANYQALIGGGYEGTVYCWIVSKDTDEAAVRSALGNTVTGTNAAIARSGDVDGNGSLNSNDWGIVNDILAAPVGTLVNSLSVKARLECDVTTGAWAEGTAFGTIDDVSTIMTKFLSGTAVTPD